MTTTVTLGEEITRELENFTFRVVDEYDLQREVGEILRARHNDVRPEHRLSVSERIDFLVDAVGIELKVDGANASVQRQLCRYARDPSVDELVLVTTRARHCAIDGVGVPLHVVLIPGVM